GPGPALDSHLGGVLISPAPRSKGTNRPPQWAASGIYQVRIDEESAGRSAAATRAPGAELEEAKMECSYAVMSLAALGVLTLGSAIVFAVMTIFALRRELPDMVGPHVFALPGDAVLTWQVGELMFDLA